MKNQKSKMVGIISYNIHSSYMNYGAALHSFAFQVYLRRLGVNSVVVDYYLQNMEGYSIKYPFLNYLRFWRVRSFLRHQANWLLGEPNNLVKYKKFKHFFNVNIKKTNKSYSHEELMNIIDIENIPFDTFVCESDVLVK